MGLLSNDTDRLTDPRLMGLLAMGSSLMQDSGWRYRPMTTGEQIGRALPAGMHAYAQQTQINAQQQQAAQEQAARLATEQQVQQQAQQAQAEAHAQAQLAEQQRVQFTQAVLGSTLSQPRQHNLLAMWSINPTEAAKRLDVALTPAKAADPGKDWIQTTRENADGSKDLVLVHRTTGEVKPLVQTGIAPPVANKRWERVVRVLPDGSKQVVMVNLDNPTETLSLGQTELAPVVAPTSAARTLSAEEQSEAAQLGYPNAVQAYTHPKTKVTTWYDAAGKQVERDEGKQGWPTSTRVIDGEVKEVRFDPADPNNFEVIGETGEIAGTTKEKTRLKERAEDIEENTRRWKAEHGLSQQRMEAQQAQFGKRFQEQVRQYGETRKDKRESDAQRQRNVDRAYEQTLVAYEETIRANAVQEGFTEQQIQNQLKQFQTRLKVQAEQFQKTHGLAVKKFEQTQTQAAQQQQNWLDTFNRGKFTNDRDYQFAVQRHEDKLIQDGIRNNLTREQIENQVSQYRETFEQKGVQFDKSFDLKERIFTQRTEDSVRNYQQRVTEYQTTQDFRERSHEEQQAHLDRTYQQSLVEHLARIQQQGIENGHSDQRIAQAQERLVASQEQFVQTHGIAIQRLDLDQLRFDVDQTHRATVLAQEAARFEYRQGRDAKQDAQWRKGYEQRVQEHLDRLEQQGTANGYTRERIDTQKAQFRATLDFQKLQYATQEGRVPVTLYGKEAREWAQKNNVKLRKAGTPVIKFDQHGNFGGKVDYLQQGKYGKDQLDYITAAQKDWMTNVDTKAANKLGRLLVSLENLSADDTGVSEFAMIYKFMKSLDETSTVLASEFRNASGAGRSALDNLMQWGDRQFTGTQLRPEQKQDILKAVTSVAHAHLTDTMLQNLDSVLKLSKQHGIEDKDMRGFLPNALGDYFKKYPSRRGRNTGGSSGNMGAAATDGKGADAQRQQTAEAVEAINKF